MVDPVIALIRAIALEEFLVLLMRDATLQMSIIVHRRPIYFQALAEAIGGLPNEVTVALVCSQIHSFHELRRDRDAVSVRAFAVKHICDRRIIFLELLS